MTPDTFGVAIYMYLLPFSYYFFQVLREPPLFLSTVSNSVLLCFWILLINSAWLTLVFCLDLFPSFRFLSPFSSKLRPVHAKVGFPFH